MPIHTKTGKLLDNIYLIDTLQYGMHGIVSAFCYWDGKTCVLMDVGTSDNVQNMMSTIRKLDIPYEKVAGIVNTHYHFDHGGGCLRLWTRMVKKNPYFKIMVPQDMHDKLQNSVGHLKEAATTFGDFVGTMDPVDEAAFQIVKKDEDLPLDLENGFKIQLLATPGHSTDHVSPSVFRDNSIHFIHMGESAGALFHHKKLVSMPTSMPSFDYSVYKQSFQKIRNLKPNWVGFCHFGAISTQVDIETYFNEHVIYMEDFRAAIKNAFAENPTTKYVFDQTERFWTLERFDPDIGEGTLGMEFLQKLRLALTYHMMVDLGMRKPKYS